VKGFLDGSAFLEECAYIAFRLVEQSNQFLVLTAESPDSMGRTQRTAAQCPVGVRVACQASAETDQKKTERELVEGRVRRGAHLVHQALPHFAS
jgi:hypothetical protein